MHPLEPGDPRTLGRYRILARIGAGGMAVVYLGRSKGGRAVAVKVMHAELAREPEYRERFRREVAATTAAGGVHSPPVLGADPEAARPWLVTGFLPSVSLREAVERFGPLPAASVRRLAAGLAEALAALHRSGIVHLDVKPGNVLLAADGPRLIDFGIAGDPRAGGPAGSWGFMSPEQVAGAAGPPSDVYSLGATLEYARGRKPSRLRGREPARPRDGESIDRSLRTLIAECRRHDPSARPTAAELTARLAAAEWDEPPAAWLPPPVMAAIDAAAGGADNPPSPPPHGPGRRGLIIGGSAALVVAGAATIRAVTGNEGSPGPKPDTTRTRRPANAAPAASSSPSPTPSAEPVVLTFAISGDGPLTTLGYWVNGELTRPRKLPKLPWHATVEVPRDKGNVDWRIRFAFSSGRVRYRLTLDGVDVRDESHPVNTAFGYPYYVDDAGAQSLSGPLSNPTG